MRGKSHRQMAAHLLSVYMTRGSRLHRFAFAFGCVEPDSNPFTYLRGSLRAQFLKGHNYGNAVYYIARLGEKLEQRSKLRIWDYYAAGKLIHYTVDAFTYVHNDIFPGTLADHRQYEALLQNHFLIFLSCQQKTPVHAQCSAAQIIARSHAQYILSPANLLTDCYYAFTVSSLVASRIFRCPGAIPGV